MPCANHPEKEGKFYCAKCARYLCEDCLACQDPTLYCKHRTSCLIWEFVKYGAPDAQEARAAPTEAAVAPAAAARVTFRPSGKVVEARTGETLLTVAQRGDQFLDASCAGHGVCAKCKVIVEEGAALAGETLLLPPDEQQKGAVLACITKVTGDVTVRVPPAAEKRRIAIVQDALALSAIRERLPDLSPLAEAVSLALPPPTLDDPVGDFERVKRALAKGARPVDHLGATIAGLGELAVALRAGGWKATVALVDRGCALEIVGAAAGENARRATGLAVDLGTTSVVAYLVDLATGTVLGGASSLNRQVACGDDVISRILCAKGPAGLARLKGYAVQTINALVEEIAGAAGIDKKTVLAASIAGNTVMTHALLGLDPSNIRLEPYVPVATDLPIFAAQEVGLTLHPRAAVFVAPGNAAYVGGDITAGVLYAGFHRREELTLFVDVGTNGEMVLGGSEFLLSAACSAGPAFEGGGVRCGMRAVPGAIDVVSIDPATFRATFTTIGAEPPTGICGSGMIDLLAGLFLTGAIDARGKFADGLPEGVTRDGEFGREYVLVPGEGADAIAFSEIDIDNLMRAKAAIYAGVRSLLAHAGLDIGAIGRILIAGGFGKHLNVRRAVEIGMFPDVDPAFYEYLGNTSVAGATMTLLSRTSREEIRGVARGMTYVDFSSSPRFFEEYQSALFLPHTDRSAFPSVAKRAPSQGAIR